MSPRHNDESQFLDQPVGSVHLAPPADHADWSACVGPIDRQLAYRAAVATMAAMVSPARTANITTGGISRRARK